MKITHFKHREIQGIRTVTGTIAQIWKELKERVGRNDTYHIKQGDKLVAECYWDWRNNMAVLKIK